MEFGKGTSASRYFDAGRILASRQNARQHLSILGCIWLRGLAPQLDTLRGKGGANLILVPGSLNGQLCLVVLAGKKRPAC